MINQSPVWCESCKGWKREYCELEPREDTAHKGYLRGIMLCPDCGHHQFTKQLFPVWNHTKRRVSLSFRWYDLWVGVYYDRRARVLHFCPLPTICLSIRLGRT